MLLLLCALWAAEPTSVLEYNRDVRPILADKCFACHGFDEKARQAELRLDLPETAYASHDGKAAIKPGDLAHSEAWQRIISTDPDLRMPPADSNLTLTAKEQATLKAWIEQGAPYAAHWAFVPPTRPTPPTADRHPIDAFVHAELDRQGLKPAPPADRALLARRVALDLTGLPPSADEVADFVADADPKAYERYVDRLLRSPHFGERLALDWLDAARYADTNGYSIDGGRHLWLWRDWVIQAFNDNMPYDQFLVEQLAGDLLPNRTDAQLIATGFQRNNMVTHEGGTIPEENLTNYNADRVKTLGETVLGLTLGCAQCHDHKFDPITQRDYYRIYAYFNTLSERGLDGNGGVNPVPQIQARTVLRTNEEPHLREQIAALKAALATPEPALVAAWEKREQARLAERGRNLRVHPVKVLKVSTPNRGAGFDVTADNKVQIRNPGGLAAFDILTQMPAMEDPTTPITGLRVVFHPVADYPGNGWGNGSLVPRKKDEPIAKGTFMLTALDATADTVPGDQVNLHELLPITRVTASSWDPAHPPTHCLDRRNELGWMPDLAATGPVHLTANLGTPVDSKATPYLTVQVNFGHGRDLVAGLIEIQVLTGTDDGTDLPAAIVDLLGKPAATRTAAESAQLASYCAAHGDEFRRLRTDLANSEERLAVLTQPFPTMVMDEAPKPRTTFILARGDYSKPTEPVVAGTPAALPAAAEGTAANRLGLARWLTMPHHPLTARVAVNRLWKQCFGTGLVASAADFGNQGEWPSHPALLDWLAVEFVDSGWDVKALLRQIVLSQTYQQSSAASAELLERDPGNRLLARGPRFRLPAELIRDSALKVSGLFVDRVGGPSVNPYTPVDLWREVSHYGSTPATAQTFVQDHGEKLYRRSLYTYWKRTAPPPNMLTFDAPNREVCTVDRANTTTPLQALVILNDVQFVEAARGLATRALQQPGNDDDRLTWMWREALSRAPAPREMAVLTAAVAREHARYAADPAHAEALLQVGESPRPAGLDRAALAAWTQVAALIFNHTEFVTRN